MDTPSRPLDLAQLTEEEVKLRLGELVLLSLRLKSACVLLTREPGQVTLLDPDVLDGVPDEDWAAFLLDMWSEEEVADFLESRYARRNHE